MEPPDRFEDLTPRFLGALGHLARQGLLRDTSDALDILHDFYLDVWPGLVARYQPAIAPFDRYAISALLRFARGRAARNATLRARLLRDPDAGEQMPPDTAGSALDEARVRHAVEQLSDVHRRLLRLIYGEGISERDAARQLRVSRYEARVQLAEALTAIAAQIADPAVLSTDETKLARALFVDGELLELAAADLGLSLAKARAIRRGLLRRFGRLAMIGLTNV